MTKPAPDNDRLKRRIVIGVLSAMALATLDQTIVAPALPSIGADFGGSAYLSWVVAAYLVTATAVTPLYGKIADARGRRPALFAAIAIFLAGALMAAAAPNLPMLIAGRAVQGIGGGGLIALAQTVIADVVAPRERGRYVGYISAVWAGSSVLGPTLGGLIAQYLHWKFIFLLNLPLALAAFALSERALRSLPERREARPIDLVGAALVIASTVLVLMALTWLAQPHTARTLAPAALIGGLLLAAALRAHLRRAADPLIPLRLFADPVVRAGAACVFFGFGGYLGLSVAAPFYLVTVVGVSPTQAGMALMAMLVGAVIGANTAGRLMSRIAAYKRLGALGMALAVCATAALAARAPHASFLEIEALLALIGLGSGAQNPISIVSVQNAVDHRDLGVATALVGFVRSLGGAFGVAAMGAVLSAAPGDGGAGVAPFVLAFTLAAASFVAAGLTLEAMEQRPLRARSRFDESRDAAA